MARTGPVARRRQHRLAAIALVLLAALQGAGPALGQEVPVPPCAGTPSPAWPAAGAAPTVRLWHDDELPRGWTPPACSGVERPAGAMLVAVAGSFRHEGDTASILARLAAVSTHTSILYWSVSKQAWRPVLDAASALSGPDPDARRDDFRPEELRSGARLHILYDDSEPIGPVVYATELREVGPDGFTMISRNAGPARLLGFTVAAPGHMSSMLTVERAAPGLFHYYTLTSVALAPMAAATVPDASHINRAVATYRFVAGIPGDAEPPAAPR
jgi:hypothetical protein